MFRVGHTRGGIPVLVHWTIPALGLFFLAIAHDAIVTGAAMALAYIAMLLIHELGHQWVAQRRGFRVWEIRLYPLHGQCLFEAPEFPYDEAVIAWGGVAAQVLVAVPCAVFVIVAGDTPYEPVNIALGILGFVSPFVAALNLLPIKGLDGKLAWSAIPIFFHKRRMSSPRRRPSRASARPPQTAMEAMEEALRKARRGKRDG